MKRRLITAKVLLIALSVACLCSTSILSGEHPWDGDGGGRQGSNGDYDPDGGFNTIDPKSGSPTSQTASVVSPMDPRGKWLFRLSLVATKYLYGTHSRGTINTSKWSVREKQR